MKERQAAKERLVAYFENGPGRECQIDHLYFERRFVNFNYFYLTFFDLDYNVGQLLSMDHPMNRLLVIKINHFNMIYLE